MKRHALFVHDNRSLGGVGHVSQQIALGLSQRGWAVDHLNLAQPASAWAHLSKVSQAKGVIVATQNFSTSYVACALGAIAGRPWVMCVHGPVTDVIRMARVDAFKQKLMRFVYRRAPVIVCSSQASLQSLRRFCPTEASQRVDVIRNTADPAFFTSGARTPRQHSHSLGFVGRLSEEKRPMLLVETLRALPRDYRLQLVGTGPLAPQLVESASEEIANGRLRFAGQLRVDAQTYRQWDVTLLASAYEGYPLVLLESLASGVPVVSTPIAAAVEMLGTHAPYMLAQDDSAQALARAVQDVLAMDGARVARDIAAINAQHDPAAFIDRWDQLLSESLRA